MRLPNRLPPLDGPVGAVVQKIYVGLAVVVVLITLAGAWVTAIDNFRVAPATAHYGLTLNNDDSRLPMLADVQAQALAAGLKSGDRLAAINDTPLTPGATTIDVGARFAQMTGPLAVTTTDAAGHAKRFVLPRMGALNGFRSQRSGLTLSTVGTIRVLQPLISALILITISLLLVRNRPRDPEATLLAFGFLLLAYSVTTTQDLWFWQLHPSISPDFVDWLEQFLLTLGYWAMFVGVCAFPDGCLPNLWARLAWIVPTTYLLANSVTGFALWTNAPLLTSALDVPIFFIVVGPVVLRYRAAPQGVQRQQIKWAAFGGVIMVLAALVRFIATSIALARLIGPAPAYVLQIVYNSVALLAFPLGILISLLRYRLYDADTVITRSTVYAILAVALVAVFACTEKVIELLGEEYFGHRLGALAGGLGAAVSAVMVAPLHHRISHWVEHRFRHDLLHLRQSLPLLMATLRETASPTHLAEAALHRVLHAVHAVGGALVGEDGRILAAHGLSAAELETSPERWLKGPKDGIVVDRSDTVLPIHIPLRIEGANPAGLLLIGPRPDGSLYGRDERDTLVEVAEPIAQSLTTALRRETAAQVVERDRAAILVRLEALEQAQTKPPSKFGGG